MILFMEYRAGTRTGGQYNQAHLYSFLRKRFSETSPERRDVRPADIAHPVRHAISALKMVRKKSARLIVISLYSGCRNVLAVRFIKKRGGKVLVMHQGLRMTFRYKNPIARWLARKCETIILRNADIVQASSDFLAREARRSTRATASILVARPGLQIEPDLQRNILDSADDNALLKLLYVGECNKVKGTIYLVEALTLLKDLNVGLDMVGGCGIANEYGRKVRQVIERNGLDDSVRIRGVLEPASLKKLYEKANIYIMPSLSEGYGMALAEAICFGLPVVATRAGAIPELVEDGVNAILVEPGDSRALAAAIRKLATDHELRMKMTKANLERAKTIPRWEDYERVLDNELVPAIERLTGLRRINCKT
jgi:glycosyltransferase involved in cell wall biosynthesis